MGNCFNKSNISTSDTTHSSHFLKSSVPVSVPAVTVSLRSSSSSTFTSYVLLALRYTSLSASQIPTDDDKCVIIDIGTDTATLTTRESVLRFIDSKVPQPQLVMGDSERLTTETTPLIVRAVILQHRSLKWPGWIQKWHLDRMVRWANDLSTRGGKRVVDPSAGSRRMELKKFGQSYSLLLEALLEHAQMEERVVFPLLELADRGLCKAANAEHARDLPVINGIKEDIKSIGVMDSASRSYREALCNLSTRIGVMDSASRSYREALCNLSTRLTTLQENCKEHFKEEERDVFPLMEALELSKEQQLKVLEQCLDAMLGAHSHLFKFLMEGLLPKEGMQYLDLIMACKDEESAGSMMKRIIG